MSASSSSALRRHHRRQFVKFLMASPAAGALAGFESALAQEDLAGPVTDPVDAIDVFDLEATARQTLPPAHFGYLATGTFGEQTLRANRSAFDRYYLRSRRLVDVSAVDTSVRLLGETYRSPIVLCPVGSQRGFHADGELATARAAKRHNHLQMLSSVSSTAIDDVARARGAPLWHQLYPTGSWDVTRELLRRAERAGCSTVVVTVDLPAGGAGRQRLARMIREDARDCASCHENPDIAGGPKPLFAGLGPGVSLSQASLTWDFVGRLRDATTMNVMLKGIVTADDAERCLAAGVDGIVVSNHGGRADDSGRGAIESLEEVASVARGKTTLIMDSGVRRGTDILKALALGADAVGVGRPYIWGLAAFGEAGVSRALELLHRELVESMQFSGVASLAGISDRFIGRH